MLTKSNLPTCLQVSDFVFPGVLT